MKYFKVRKSKTQNLEGNIGSIKKLQIKIFIDKYELNFT